MIKKRKQLKTSLVLIAIGVSMVLGCPASSNSTSGDTTAPTLQSSNPSRGSENFSADANITLTYSEPVQAGTGNITITPAGGNAITIVVGDAQVSIAGAVTLKPTDDLELRTGYVLTIPAGAFMDAAGNKTAELILSFRTAADLDETAPTVESSVPATDGTDFNASSNIKLTYDEPVQAGIGTITLTPTMPTGGTMLMIDVTTGVSFFGAVVTINPTADLAVSTTYTLTVPAGAFMDAAGNKTAELTRSFSTATNIVPVVVSSVPVANGINFPINSAITLTYSEAVKVGTGNITITASGGDKLTIAVTDTTQVSISGAVLTIDPSVNLEVDINYVLVIPDAGIQSLADNPAPRHILFFGTAQ